MKEVEIIFREPPEGTLGYIEMMERYKQNILLGWIPSDIQQTMLSKKENEDE